MPILYHFHCSDYPKFLPPQIFDKVVSNVTTMVEKNKNNLLIADPCNLALYFSSLDELKNWLNENRNSTDDLVLFKERQDAISSNVLWFERLYDIPLEVLIELKKSDSLIDLQQYEFTLPDIKYIYS